MIQFNLDSVETPTAATPLLVSVIGIGGSGTNVIDKIALEGMSGVDLVSMNCDSRSLQSSMAGTKIQIGKTLTQGLGCGGDPELGSEAVAASQGEIKEMLAGRNMVFLCVGLGGGTGSGAAPVIARMAREAGAFVVVFATLPFAFEGRRRGNQANVALQDLRKYANALITFENDRMGELVVPKKGVQEAFALADKIIAQSVRAVTNIVSQPGLISIGMDDLISALRNTDSRCLFGYGQAKGESRAVEALALALKSPLLDRGQMLTGARNVLVHICGGTTLTLFEIETLMRELGKHVHEEAQILFGAATDPKLQDQLSVTVLTSLNKVVPVVAIPEPAAVAPVSLLSETIVPVAAAPLMPVLRVAPALELPLAVAIDLAPKEVPVTSVAPCLTVAHTVLEEELFLGIDCIEAPLLATDSDSTLIEISALSTPDLVEETMPVPLITAVADPAHISVSTLAEVFPDELVVETEQSSLLSNELELESIESAEEVVYDPEESLDQWIAEQPENESEIALAPPAEVVPERVIRLERPQIPVARRDINPPRPEPARPIPIAPQITLPAVPAKRFVLSEIIKAKPKQPIPVPPTPVVEYVAEEDFDVPAVAPARPSPVAVSRRAPDYDRINPIRPIPAGRSTTPSSPFTPAKPVAAPAAARPVPTQQQTFDERLQPASSGSRFDRAKPTVEEGEDLDVPTFLRRKR